MINITGDDKKAIEALNRAILFLQVETCIEFVYQTDQKDYVSFKIGDYCA